MTSLPGAPSGSEGRAPSPGPIRRQRSTWRKPMKGRENGTEVKGTLGGMSAILSTNRFNSQGFCMRVPVSHPGVCVCVCLPSHPPKKVFNIFFKWESRLKFLNMRCFV
ncbi:hypothetical protein FKM82_002641 [Ascaphus truei]